MERIHGHVFKNQCVFRPEHTLIGSFYTGLEVRLSVPLHTGGFWLDHY